MSLNKEERRALLTFNRNLAVKRFKSSEKKFKRDTKLATKYKDIVNNYVENGRARKLSPDEPKTISNITNYIPHHSGIHPHRPGTDQNTSVNLNLNKVPDFLNNLVGVLIRFRTGKIAAISI